MVQLGVFVIFSIIFEVAIGAHLSDAVREVHLKKLPNESKEFEFEYDLDNGDTFRGQTYSVGKDISFFFGAENEMYWTNIGSNKHKDEKFTKTLRKVERDGDLIKFQDDANTYHMSVDGCITLERYTTEWDLENICFIKAADNPIFNFTVSSSNNSKKFNGTTYRRKADPKIQCFQVINSCGSREDLYEIEFTDIQVLSDEVFCGGYKLFPLQPKLSSLIGGGGGGAITSMVLRTLVG